MPIREDFQRARSEREKNARRTEILDAAETLLLDSGNERFAVSAVADKVGVSKSTVFLYFSNKEEMLLMLYTRTGNLLFDRFREKLRPGMSGRDFCEAFVDCALSNPTMLLLRQMLASTIERSVSVRSLIEGKREILRYKRTVAEDTERVLGLTPDKGGQLLQALTNLLAGTAQVDVNGYVDLNLMPDDVADLIRSGDTRKSFLEGAEFIFTGATGRPFD